MPSKILLISEVVGAGDYPAEDNQSFYLALIPYLDQIDISRLKSPTEIKTSDLVLRD